MTFQIRRAERQRAKLKLGISGTSGSGKTYSALRLACGIAGGDWTKVILIDTENGSGELYSHMGPYQVIPFHPPFSPQRYVEAIRFAVKGGAHVIVIDSISHEWDGIGGCLEIQTKLGGRYQDWARVTPMHKDFVDEMLHSQAHVIVTTRKKQDYAIEQNEKGKSAPKKVGLKEIQRDGFEYELTINFDVDISHFAVTSKDRTGLFMPRGPFQITDDTGRELIEWANSAREVADPEEKKPSDIHQAPSPALSDGSTQRQGASSTSTIPAGTKPTASTALESSSSSTASTRKNINFNAKMELGDESHMARFQSYRMPGWVDDKFKNRILSDCPPSSVDAYLKHLVAAWKGKVPDQPEVHEFFEICEQWVNEYL